MEKKIQIFWIFVGNLHKNYVQYIVNLIFFFNYVFLKIVTNVIIFLIVDLFNVFLFLYPTWKTIPIYIYEIIINQIIWQFLYFLLASNCIQTSNCHVSTSNNKSYEFLFLIIFLFFIAICKREYMCVV